MGIGDRREKSTGRIPTGELDKLAAQAAQADEVVALEPEDRKTTEMNPDQFRALLAVGRAVPDEARARAKTVEDAETTAAMLADIGRPRRRIEAIPKPEVMSKGSSPDVTLVTMAPARELGTAQLYPMAPRTDAWLAVVIGILILGIVGVLASVAFF